MAHQGTIMIIGAGQMGRGLTKLAANSGYGVLLHDLPSSLEQGLDYIAQELAVNTAFDAEQKTRILDNIEPVDSLKASVRADFVIEAATENLAIKQQIFTSLSNYTTENTLLATNTSSLSVTEIASSTDCPERVIGLHFFHPVSSMRLVEVVRGMKTSDQTSAIARNLAESLGKEAIEVGDHPGFVSNRLLMPMINEAIICVFDGVADAESVDRIMQVGMQHPIGPLRLADKIGLDTCLSTMEMLHRGFDDPKYRPCPLLRNMVKAGKLGCKSGEGFYLYDN